MKLRKLKIHNIASIADAEVDFQGRELRDEALFLICGETGSGKTTILDAICMALYNRTPRLVQASSRESYLDSNGDSLTLSNPVQYLKKGCWEASVELVFEAQGKEWEARWSARRANRKSDGRFQQILWEVVDLADGHSEKGCEIENIICLGFDEFRRTSMLAQGEFTAFLKSKDEDKSAILEKITGTGIYKEIGRDIAENYKYSNQTYLAKEEIIANIKAGLMTDEQVEEKKSILDSLKIKLISLENERLNLDKVDKAFKETDILKAELGRNERILASSAAECTELFAGIAFAEDVLVEEERSFNALESYLRSEEKHSEMYNASTLILAELKNISEDESKLKEYENYIRVGKTDVEAGETRVRDLSLQVDEGEKVQKAQQKISDELKNNIDSLQPEYLRNLKLAIESITRSAEELKKKEADINDIESALSSLYETQLGLQRNYESTVLLLVETEGLYNKMKESNEKWAKEARSALQVGSSCPVCGQLIASQEYLDTISDEHFESILRPVADLLEERRRAADVASKSFYENKAKIEAHEQLLVKLKQNREDARVSLNQEIEKYDRPDISQENYERICYQLNRVDELSRSLDESNSLLSALNKGQTDLMKLCSDAQVGLETLRGRLAASVNSLNEVNSRLAGSYAYVRGRLIIEGWEDEWQTDRKAFSERFRAEADKYSSAYNEYERKKARLEHISSVLENMKTVKDDLLSLLPSLRNEYSVDRYKVEGLEKKLNDVKAVIMTSQSIIKTSSKKLKEAEAVAQGYEREEVTLSLMAAEQSMKECNQSIGSISMELEIDSSNRMKIDKDLTELQRAGVERDQWKALNDVFGRKDGEYFQKIAQGFIMNDILSRANHYLKNISGRYLLEAQSGSLNILVRDMEQGGVPRSTSTVSGGESFMISLALALGLSSLGDGERSVDILFIDEGFGSLSEDYLNTVVETLQKLYDTSGKKVGIISHIEQLRSRIGTKISVTKVNQTTSKVEISG